MLRIMGIVISCSIGIVTSTNKAYTMESFTTDGKPCMTDCINNTCIATWEKSVTCVPGLTPALSYYTHQNKFKKKWCKSRCVIFSNDTIDSRCFVSDTEWDYCNSKSELQYSSYRAITSYGPCEDNCEYRGYDYSWCLDLNSKWDYCEPALYDYIILSTTKNVNSCVGPCGKYYGWASNWCMNFIAFWERCAPPSRNFSIFTNMLESAHNSDYIESLENSNTNYLLTQKVNVTGNPIYTYTVLVPALLNDPMLPIIVRARVTNKTVKSLESVKIESIPDKVLKHVRLMGMYTNIDESRPLIGNILGGPNYAYNFVPQAQRLKGGEISQWFRSESYIRNFVHVTGGWAEITVVVIYDNLQYTTRPDGFLVDRALYYPNKTLHDKVYTEYYSNEPYL